MHCIINSFLCIAPLIVIVLPNIAIAIVGRAITVERDKKRRAKEKSNRKKSIIFFCRLYHLYKKCTNTPLVESWYDEVHLFTGNPSNVQFSSLSGVGHFTQVKILHVQGIEIKIFIYLLTNIFQFKMQIFTPINRGKS